MDEFVDFEFTVALFRVAHKLAFQGVLADLEARTSQDACSGINPFPWQIVEFQFYTRIYAIQNEYVWRIWWREDYVDANAVLPDGHLQYFDRPNGRRVNNFKIQSLY